MHLLDAKTRRALEKFKRLGMISVDPEKQLKPSDIRKTYCVTDEDREKHRAYSRERYRRNRKKILARLKAWRDAKKAKEKEQGE